MTGSRVRVFLCEDSEPFRLLVREVLGDCPDVEVVGEAGSLDETVAGLATARPDVVLADLVERERPDEMLARLRAVAPHARLILYTGMPADLVPRGADGVVHKSAGFAELHDVLTATAGT